jgi:fucose permease
MMLANLVGCVASAGLLLLDTASAVLMWTGTCSLGFSMASVFPTILVFAERRIPITGQVTGTLLVGASMGGMLLPWLIGQLFASRGPGVLPATMMAVLIAAMAIFVVAMGWSARQLTTEKLS